jgi:hypothetical protein
MMSMKKKLVKVLALVMALAMMFTLAACSLTLNDMLIVKRAYKHVKQMDSMCFDGNAEMSITIGKVPMKITGYADCQCIIDPTTVYIDAQFDLGNYGTMNLPMYMYSDGENFNLVLGMSKSNGITWVTNSTPLREKDSDITVESVLTELQRDSEALVVGENETINDLECRPFTIKVPGQTLMDALALEVPEGCDATIDDTLITVWITVTDGMPLRLSGDLASVLQYIIDVNDPDYLPDMKVTSLPVVVDINSFNSVKDLELPN